MIRHQSRRAKLVRFVRRGRRGEVGAQSLEWIGLGGFVLAAMSAAGMYAQQNLGGSLGNLLLTHIQKVIGQ